MSNRPCFLSEADTKKVLEWTDVIACLTAVYREYARSDIVPPRAVARRNGTTLRSLSAISPSGRLMGIKVISRSASKRLSYLIALWDQGSAELECLMDGKHITAMRTACASAVATDQLMSKTALHVGVLGSGAEAAAHVRAIAAVRQVRSLAVFSPTLENRDKFAAGVCADLGVDCRSDASPRDAVANADLIIAAARSRDETPILRGEWITPGTMIISVGSTLPEQREIDSEAVRRAACIVADVPQEVVNETGDMLAARRDGVIFEDKVIGLADVVQGNGPQIKHDDIVLYKSVGSALQDIAVAELCLTKARQQRLGTVVPVDLSIKTRR